MVQIKINNIAYEIPTGIEDVTLGRFLELRNIDINNTLEVIYWAVNAKPLFIETDTVEKEIGVVFALAKTTIEEVYDYTENKAKFQVPDNVEVLGVPVQLRKGLLNDLPYWPYVVTKFILSEELKKTPFDPTDRYPEILAHYLYSAVAKSPYDENKAAEFVEVTKEISLTAALPLGNFFLKKHKELPQLKLKSFLLSRTNLLKKLA